jgi:predicted DNA-binding protein
MILEVVLLPTKQIEKGKNYVALSVRLDKEDNRRFSALLALNETTAADFFRGAVKEYIKQHEHLLSL